MIKKKKQITKSDKISLEFNQNNNDLIFQIITSFVKDIPKEISTFCIRLQSTNVALKMWQYFVPNFLLLLLHYHFDCNFD